MGKIASDNQNCNSRADGDNGGRDCGTDISRSRNINNSTASLASVVGDSAAAHEPFHHVPTTPSISSVSSSCSSGSSAALSGKSVLLSQPAPMTATTVAERGHALHDPCIDEMENCSLQESERCNCVWQLMRSVHAIFHWLNRITCVRHRKHKSHYSKQPDADLQGDRPAAGTEMTIHDAVGNVTTPENQAPNSLAALAVDSSSQHEPDTAAAVDRSNNATFEKKLA